MATIHSVYLSHFIILFSAMQKYSIKWSILLWSVFLSLVMIALFISISGKIKESLENNSYYTAQSIDSANIQWVINNYMEKSFSGIIQNTTINIGKNKKIVFEDNRNFLLTIESQSEQELFSPRKNNITLSLLTGNSLQYKKSTETEYSTLSNTVTISTNTWEKISIKSFTWYNTLQVNGEWPVLQQQQKYKIFQNIWGIERIKEQWFVNY